LLAKAAEIGTKRVFCLTFEVKFFGKFGFEEISDVPVDAETYAEMVRSNDDGVAEFLDLARVKQNTLGNTRMLRTL
jgi:amino-acid N-acetyltransferase